MKKFLVIIFIVSFFSIITSISASVNINTKFMFNPVTCNADVFTCGDFLNPAKNNGLMGYKSYGGHALFSYSGIGKKEVVMPAPQGYSYGNTTQYSNYNIISDDDAIRNRWWFWQTTSIIYKLYLMCNSAYFREGGYFSYDNLKSYSNISNEYHTLRNANRVKDETEYSEILEDNLCYFQTQVGLNGYFNSATNKSNMNNLVYSYFYNENGGEEFFSARNFYNVLKSKGVLCDNNCTDDDYKIYTDEAETFRKVYFAWISDTGNYRTPSKVKGNTYTIQNKNRPAYFASTSDYKLDNNNMEYKDGYYEKIITITQKLSSIKKDGINFSAKIGGNWNNWNKYLYISIDGKDYQSLSSYTEDYIKVSDSNEYGSYVKIKILIPVSEIKDFESVNLKLSVQVNQSGNSWLVRFLDPVNSNFQNLVYIDKEYKYLILESSGNLVNDLCISEFQSVKTSLNGRIDLYNSLKNQIRLDGTPYGDLRNLLNMNVQDANTACRVPEKKVSENTSCLSGDYFTTILSNESNKYSFYDFPTDNTNVVNYNLSSFNDSYTPSGSLNKYLCQTKLSFKSLFPSDDFGKKYAGSMIIQIESKKPVVKATLTKTCYIPNSTQSSYEEDLDFSRNFSEVLNGKKIYTYNSHTKYFEQLTLKGRNLYTDSNNIDGDYQEDKYGYGSIYLKMNKVSSSSDLYTGTVNINYYIEDLFLETGTGKEKEGPIDESDKNITYAGSGIYSRFDDNVGKHTFNFSISLRKMSEDFVISDDFDNGRTGACKYTIIPSLTTGDDSLGNLNIKFRKIDKLMPFPGKDANGRNVGGNWCDNDYCGSKSNKVIKEKIIEANDSLNSLKATPIFSINLTPELIQKIRDYNKNYTYDNLQLNENASDNFFKSVNIEFNLGE